MFEDIDFTDGVSEQENLLRFLSISIRTTNDDGSYSYSKVYLNGLTSNTVLFGGTDDHVVEVNESIELVFRIEFEMFDTLVENNICSEEDFDAYQALQGMKVSESFKFLDVSLSSHKPE